MKNLDQFTPLTEKEALEINGGGPLDGLLNTIAGLLGGLPIVGGLATTVINLLKGLLGNLPIPGIPGLPL